MSTFAWERPWELPIRKPSTKGAAEPAEMAFRVNACVPAVASTVNDWFEGARRLTGDDVAHWEKSAAEAQQAALRAAATQAEAEEDDELAMF